MGPKKSKKALAIIAWRLTDREEGRIGFAGKIGGNMIFITGDIGRGITNAFYDADRCYRV